MKKINKTLCELSKDDFSKFDKLYRKVVKKPKYFCKKCLRACAEKDLLCKPSKLNC